MPTMTAPTLSRRHFLQSSVLGAALMTQACAHTPPPSPIRTSQAAPMPQYQHPTSGGRSLHIVAPSGFAPRPEQAQLGIQRLTDAGFIVSNQETAYRRHQRFAGTDEQRIADFQTIATGQIPTPKILMGLRGGYGAMRLLPHIDWASLGAKMREHGTLFFGFSDVCAMQLALLAQGKHPAFSGPMVYSEFGRNPLSSYTMHSFIQNASSPQFTIHVPQAQINAVPSIEATAWGGNLSVLAALVGSPYLPDIQGGILFLEDVGEQPYRIERMLQTLHLAGILKKQRAIILGDFRMGNIRDVYDSSYNLDTVAAQIRRVSGIPVLSGFPFGHIADKATFPLGSLARLQADPHGGYSVQFTGHPHLNAAELNLQTLLFPPEIPSTDTPNTSEDLGS